MNSSEILLRSGKRPRRGLIATHVISLQCPGDSLPINNGLQSQMTRVIFKNRSSVDLGMENKFTKIPAQELQARLTYAQFFYG
jgi:hypothetical protein